MAVAQTHTGPERVNSTARERSRRIHRILRSRICLLDYPPGHRLSEEVLAEEFGVSRTPLRRALGWLENEKLVTSVHGVGTMVTDVDIDELHQVYQLRMELEALVGTLSPVTPTEETLAGLRDLRERAHRLCEAPDPRTFAELNAAFFHAFTSLSASEPLRDISERLYYRTSRIWLKSIPQMSLAEEMVIFHREVSDVIAAVEIGDLVAAGLIRRAHISMSFTRLRDSR